MNPFLQSEIIDNKKKLIILGAGPAGLALAMKLTERPSLNFDVLVLEKSARLGGLAASFNEQGLFLDLGSHRLHPATSPQILADLHRLLAGDLLDRPRYGRIRLMGRFVQFPLKPFELLRKLPLSFVSGFLFDSLAQPFVQIHEPKSFSDVLKNGLGKTICDSFYFPYARKLWGLAPDQIAAIQAQRRVAANSFGKMAAKVLHKVPGFKKPGSGRFFYPAQGFGQISYVLAEEVQRLGGKIRTEVHIDRIEQRPDKRFAVFFNENESVIADFIFSTIPITVLTKLLQPSASPELLAAAEQLRFRGMVLHYLILDTPQFTPYDAHYFPEKELIFSRLSEPKNYSAALEPQDKTGLCFEIPCEVDDVLWQLSDAEMTERVLADLRKADLAINCQVLKGFSVRVPYIYPIYDLSFSQNLQLLQNHLSRFSGLVSLGRQGLFVHDNTHHTIDMAYKAADCLSDDGYWQAKKWQSHLAAFAENVVED